VKEDKRQLRIGALTTLAELVSHPAVRERAPLLAQAARTVASPQLRNMGTVGGNLCQEPRCWYYRSPENHFFCLRKGGERCAALLGENRYHSVFGASHTALPGCAAHCPAHVAIPEYLGRVRAGELGQAAEILLQRNPMPAITGRVCPHYCQLGCSRAELDEAVSTRVVERMVGDHILEDPARYYAAPKKETRKRVAVVGAGPAGLSAAYYLRLAGHRVTVYERMSQPGGMLRYAIPAYRLPKDVLLRQIEAYERMGIELKLGVELNGKATTLKRLRKDHDAVFLATGAWRGKGLGIEREALLISGLDFLIDIQRGRREAPGRNVLVIGGGSVACDVAISARRLGAERVTMACLEARDIMPAFLEDLELALEEGIQLLPSWGPHRVLLRDGAASGMELVRCTSVFDAEGRFRPTFDPATTMTVEADSVVLAIGQAADLSYADRSLKTARGLITADEHTQASSLPGVFAGGDVVSGASTVVSAIAAGRRAALAIQAYLRDARPAAEATPPASAALVAVNATESLAHKEQARAVARPVATRTIDAEDTRTLDRQAIEAEAQRCVSCGCVAVNASDLAPALVALGATIKTTARSIPAEEFFAAGVMTTTVLRPDELVTEIQIPPRPPGCKQSYLKFRIRNAIDFPIVGVATVLTLEGDKVADARIALGAVAPVPLRAREAETFLAGKVLTEETVQVAGELAVKGAQVLARNRYKVQIVKALLRKALLDAVGPR